MSSANKITTNASAPATNWVFFAVTYQSSTNQVQFYFGNNATDAASDGVKSYNRGPVGSNIARLAIGHFNSVTRSGALDRMFKGLMDEIRIYGTALSLSEIISVQRGTSGARINASTKGNTEAQTETDMPEAEIEVAGTDELQAYPNPLTSGETLYLELPVASGELRISDAMGKSRQILQVTDRKVEVPMRGLAEGLYLLKYRGPKGMRSVKVRVK
jgi:hypothetical protein